MRVLVLELREDRARGLLVVFLRDLAEGFGGTLESLRRGASRLHVDFGVVECKIVHGS